MKNDLLIYKDKDGNVKVDAIFKDETLWMSQKNMAELFGVNSQAITKHLINIYNEGELDKNSTCSKMEQVQKEGNRQVRRNTEFYNLDAIIAVGYRVSSKKATEFRMWATKVLKEYLIKGFVLNDERFIKGSKFSYEYFEELLERIKTIRISERVSFQKITDLFIETSVDFNPKSEEAYKFFKIVQNKLHFAVTGKTAAELIYERANSEEVNMGLTSWKDSPSGLIYKYDVTIAKNYLKESELKKLNRLTLSFLDYAEDMAEEHNIMTMQDWILATDKLLEFRNKKVLKDSGSISHKQAVDKAENEYEKYRLKQDREYISFMDEFYQKYMEESKNEL